MALDVKRSNCNLFLNFCQFSDQIAIQNDSFSSYMTEFSPETIVNAVLQEARELFDCVLELEVEEMQQESVLADETRFKYILLSLVH